MVMVAGPPIIVACSDPLEPGTINAFDLPPGGQFVNPNVVDCGDGGFCGVNPGMCCLGPGVEGGATCDFDGGCPPQTVTITCNEAADCPYGSVCCGTPPTEEGGTLYAHCATSCSPSQVQLCRTNGECPGDKCYIERCVDKRVYEMCEPFSSPAFGCAIVKVYPDGGLEL